MARRTIYSAPQEIPKTTGEFYGRRKGSDERIRPIEVRHAGSLLMAFTPESARPLFDFDWYGDVPICLEAPGARGR